MRLLLNLVLVFALGGCAVERGCKFTCENCAKVGFDCFKTGTVEDLPKP